MWAMLHTVDPALLKAVVRRPPRRDARSKARRGRLIAADPSTPVPTFAKQILEPLQEPEPTAEDVQSDSNWLRKRDREELAC